MSEEEKNRRFQVITILISTFLGGLITFSVTYLLNERTFNNQQDKYKFEQKMEVLEGLSSLISEAKVAKKITEDNTELVKLVEKELPGALAVFNGLQKKQFIGDVDDLKEITDYEGNLSRLLIKAKVYFDDDSETVEAIVNYENNKNPWYESVNEIDNIVTVMEEEIKNSIN